MTAGFGTLYYTDCVPGQGLQGGAGFQFQAASGAPAAEAMAVVQRTALYEPPPSWMRERRPVGDYPLSLAHTAEAGLLVTAAGRYLGREANGTREGNQFTHAVATRDPTGYGLVRPAQLWAAPWWASGPAPTTDLDPAPVQPAPGPLDSETVRDRVRAAPGGAPLLVALLSAVHRLADPRRRRTIVLVTVDPELAACWIAAATLLLPQPVALRASFKIFVADARYGQHDIIALHPNWAGSWVDGAADSGTAVFDLDSGRADPAEPTAAARFWVPRFVTDDVYDVLDAVELAGQFARARAAGPGPPVPTATDPTPGPTAEPTAAEWTADSTAAERTAEPSASERTEEPTAAERTAAVVVAAGERLVEPEQPAELAEWLLAAPASVVGIARDRVLDAVLAAEPRAAVVRTLAAAVAARGWSGPLAPIQDALLRAELAEVLAGADGIATLRALLEPSETGRRPIADGYGAPPAPSVETPAHPTGRAADADPSDPADPAADGDPRTTARREAVEAALRAARPDQVPAVLTLAHRHGVRPVAQRYRGAAHAFACWWVDRTDGGLAPDAWPAPPEARDWVRDEVRNRLAGPHSRATASAVREHWWRYLRHPGNDLLDPLDQLVVAAAVEHLEPAERADAVQHVLYQAFASRPPDEHPCTLAWRVLFGDRSPVAAEVSAFLLALREHGSALSTPTASRIGEVLRAERPISEHGLWCAGELQGLDQPLPRDVDEQAAQDRQLHRLLDELVAPPPARSPAEIAVHLSAISDPVLVIRAPEVVEVLLTVPREAGVEVLRRCCAPPYRLAAALERRWPAPSQLPDPMASRAVALSFLLVKGPAMSVDHGGDLVTMERRLEDLVRAMSEPARAAVHGGSEPPLGRRWHEWVAEITSTRRRLRRRLTTRPDDQADSRSGGRAGRGS